MKILFMFKSVMTVVFNISMGLEQKIIGIRIQTVRIFKVMDIILIMCVICFQLMVIILLMD